MKSFMQTCVNIASQGVSVTCAVWFWLGVVSVPTSGFCAAQSDHLSVADAKSMVREYCHKFDGMEVRFPTAGPFEKGCLKISRGGDAAILEFEVVDTIGRRSPTAIFANRAYSFEIRKDHSGRPGLDMVTATRGERSLLFDRVPAAELIGRSPRSTHSFEWIMDQSNADSRLESRERNAKRYSVLVVELKGYGQHVFWIDPTADSGTEIQFIDWKVGPDDYCWYQGKRWRFSEGNPEIPGPIVELISSQIGPLEYDAAGRPIGASVDSLMIAGGVKSEGPPGRRWEIAEYRPLDQDISADHAVFRSIDLPPVVSVNSMDDGSGVPHQIVDGQLKSLVDAQAAEIISASGFRRPGSGSGWWWLSAGLLVLAGGWLVWLRGRG